jgi:hypothetical protein
MLQLFPAPVRAAAQASGRARLHSGCFRRTGAARRVVGARVVAAAASADGGEDLYAVLGVERSADGASFCGSTDSPQRRATVAGLTLRDARPLRHGRQDVEDGVQEAGAEVPPGRERCGTWALSVYLPPPVPAALTLSPACHTLVQADAAQRFRSIKAAYTTLSDPELRAQYDRRSSRGAVALPAA